MASPHVAGLAALMRSVWPTMTPSDFDSALVSGKLTSFTGGVSAKSSQFGYGLADAARSVAYALEKRQAGGSAPVYVNVEPSAVDFGSSGSTQAVLVRRIGGATVRDISPLVFARWLRIAKSGSSESADTYTLSVDRTGLSPGAYSVIVRVTDSLGATNDVAVSMRVSGSTANSGSGAAIYVLVWDQLAQKTVAYVQVNIEALNTRDFSLTPLKSSSTYLLIAGSDSDNDRVICEIGELCSAWPIDEKLSGVSSSTSTAGMSLSLGFENRSTASIKGARVGGIWHGQIADSDLLVFTAETGDVQAVDFTDETFKSTIWGKAISTGSEIKVDYTAASGEIVTGTGVLKGVIEERKRISGDIVFTDRFGSVASESEVELLFQDVYKHASSLASVTGRWVGGDGEAYEIDPSGKFSFVETVSNCKGSGQIRVISPSFNMYDLRFNLNGCAGQFASFNGALVTGLAVLDFSESVSRPPMVFLGQNRIGSRVFPAIFSATRVD
jgi:hypothetical protein